MQDTVAQPSENTYPNDTSRLSISSANRHSTAGPGNASVDPDDANQLVIASLRTQIQDLVTQVNQLNGKLVQSYDRISDLEDNIHVSSATLRSSTIKISQLELERAQHLAALNTGLLVEKAHVTAELTRLMERATEEAAQRGQAESARADIEKDLDDLSANLFDQANNMVAEARLARAISEQKVETAETALRGAEEAVALMQEQMQVLQAEKEASARIAEQLRTQMGADGKLRDFIPAGSGLVSPRLLRLHSPYHEYLGLLAHLRHLHVTHASPPNISGILNLPFIARLLTEDSWVKYPIYVRNEVLTKRLYIHREPTVRLDLSPSLNWLSRRSVLAAIHNGQLIIEPMATASVLEETATMSSDLLCSLCGMSILKIEPHHRPPRSRTTSATHNGSWSTSLFKNFQSTSSNTTTPQHKAIAPTSSNDTSTTTTLYVFRIAAPVTTGSSIGTSLPLVNSSSSPSASSGIPPPPLHPLQKHATHPGQTRPSTAIYPLCQSGWCLHRLRSTCSLWAFVRAGVIDKVWEESISVVNLSSVPKHVDGSATGGATSVASGGTSESDKPSQPSPITPRKRSLWGMASALSERASSWATDSEKNKSKEALAVATNTTATPPTAAATSSHIQTDKTNPQQPPSVSSEKTEAQGLPTPISRPSTPPPLPKRGDGRRPVMTAQDQTPIIDQDYAKDEGDNKRTTQSSLSPSSSLFENHDHDSQTPPSLPPKKDSTLSVTSSSADSQQQKQEEDSFATPSEEIPEPPIVSTPVSAPIPVRAPVPVPALPPRPTTPSSIPLPESAANTPSNLRSSFPSDVQQRRTSTPPRSASPAAAAAALQRVGSPPLRTGSPAPAPGNAPPPLPRRAAARAARPTSMLISQATAAAIQQRAASPARAAAREDKPKDEGRRTSVSTPPGSALRGGSRPASMEVQPKAPPAHEDISSTATTTTPAPEASSSNTGASTEEDGVAASSPPSAPLDSEPATSESKPDTAISDTHSLPPVPPRVSGFDNAAAAPVTVAPAADQASPQPEEAVATTTDLGENRNQDSERDNKDDSAKLNGNDHAHGDGDNVATKQQQQQDSSQHYAQFVTDETWEERTWKELTRLREEMFWARIGGLRD